MDARSGASHPAKHQKMFRAQSSLLPRRGAAHARGITANGENVTAIRERVPQELRATGSRGSGGAMRVARMMPSFFMRNRSVFGCIPSRSAVLPGPLMRPPDSRRIF
jgi:hypothetical protein